MRQFSTAVSNIIANNDNFKYFFLIELHFSTVFRFTSYGSDIVYANGSTLPDGTTASSDTTYTSDGGLFQFDPPQFSSVVDREAYKVIITDISNQFLGEFKAGVINKSIRVFVGLIDPSSNSPLTSANDIISLYSGFVDSPSIENDWEQKLAVIEGTSPMADLDMVRSMMVSKDGMDQLSSSDTSYDRIYEDSEIALKWGRV